MYRKEKKLNQNIEHALKVFEDACTYKIVNELKPSEVCKYFLRPSELKQCLQHGVGFFEENNEVSHKLWDIIVALDLICKANEYITCEKNEIYKFDLDF